MSSVLSDSTQARPADLPLDGTPRTLCTGRWPGVEFFVKEQDISRLTTWSISETRHAVVVHLRGPIHRLETELSGAGAVMDPPMAGEAWVIPAHARYASLAHGKTVRYAELFLDPEFLPEIAGLQAPLPPVRPLAGYYDEFLYRTVERLEHVTRQPDDLARMTAQAMSQVLFLHFFREYTDSSLKPRRKSNPPRLEPREERLLKDYVDAHLGQTITLPQLASLVHLRTHELLTAFRGSFGATPAQYVIEQRLRRARWLLLTASLDITAIALETGFSSHAHLTAVFRSRLGITPKDFRASQKR